MLKREGYVVWPAYLDRSLSHREGRRIPLRLSVRAPTAEKIAECAGKLGWHVVVEDGAHPRMWWRVTGKVIVKPSMSLSKQMVLKVIAEKILQEGRKDH